ncbi:heterokaryon incompatibility protein-domain-containing protein, partial [Cladorrhinum samala]
ANYELMQKWIKNCRDNHGAVCNDAAPSLEVGHTRLIDTESSKIVPYPVPGETAAPGSPPAVEYTCLSYVWGGQKQDISRLGDELLRLPNTIQDAVEVTKLLKIRYLGVDAVCIDQNDDADKQRQIAIMDKIYRGAWATIVALSATSSESGMPRV